MAPPMQIASACWRQRLDHAELARDLGAAHDREQRALRLADDAQVLELGAAADRRPPRAPSSRPCRRSRRARGARCRRRRSRRRRRAPRAPPRSRGRSSPRPGGSAGSRAAAAARGRARRPPRPRARRCTPRRRRRPCRAGRRGAAPAAAARAPGSRLPFGPAEVRGDHHARPGAQQPPQRRQRGPDARIVGDDARLERHVQVGAHEDALAAHPRGEQLVQGRNRHGVSAIPSARARSTTRQE